MIKLREIPADQCSRAEPGDWWYCDWYVNMDHRSGFDWKEVSFLSTRYLSSQGDGEKPLRSPIVVMLPNRRHWLIDGKASNGDDGWIVSKGPNGGWNAEPSILMGDYHGYLRDGYLTPDLEGRKYGV